MAYNETYASDLAPAYEGMIADTSLADVISRTVETSGGIGFGKPVAQGALERGCKADVSATLDILGITVRNVAVANDGTGSNLDEYPQYDGAGILRKGVIWVKVSDAGGVVAGDPVWMAKATGLFSNADLGSSGSIRLAGARWESTGANNGLARMRVDFNVPNVAGA